MAIQISSKTREKLASKHNVSEEEVAQCFANRVGNYLLDTREDHASDPPTLWFVSETDHGRKLKIVFVHRDGNIYLRTAFLADEKAIRIYDKYGR